MKHPVVLAMLLLLCVLLQTATAQDPDLSSEPVRISADRLEVDDAVQSLVFFGNAVAQQGDLSIASEQLTITYREEDRQIRKIVAEGHVKIMQGARVATGRQAVYDRSQQRIVLSGDPVVKEGPNSLRGEEIILFLDGKRSLVNGGSGRVQAVFQPGSGADN